MREVGGTNGQLHSNPWDIARWVEWLPCTWGFQWCPWDPELHSVCCWILWTGPSLLSVQPGCFVQEEGAQTGSVGWSSTFTWRGVDCKQVPALCRPFERDWDGIYRVREGHRATLVPEICVNGLKQTRVRKCRCGAIGVSMQLKAHKLKEEWKRFSSLLIHGNTIAWPLH